MTSATDTIVLCPFCGNTRAPEVSDVGECEECANFDYCLHRQENHTCEGCGEWERPMFVVCNYNVGGCGASGPYRKTKAEAIAAWNSRAERTCECIAEYAKSPIDGKTIVLHRCSSCHELMRPHMSYCPNCGARRVGE